LKVKKTLCFLLLILLFVQCDKVNQAKLEVLAKAVNMATPIQIDETTRMDSCVALSGYVLRYYYTILGIEDLDQFSVPVFDLYQQRELIASLRKENDREILELLKNGLTLDYTYYCNGRELATISITETDYFENDDLSIDSIAFKKIEKITSIMKPEFPQILDTGTEIMEDIRAIYPRTVEVNVVEVEFRKTNDFDSLSFKKQKMDEYFASLDENLYSTFLGGNANIVYRYVFRDRDAKYLATVESTIKDYKQQIP